MNPLKNAIFIATGVAIAVIQPARRCCASDWDTAKSDR